MRPVTAGSAPSDKLVVNEYAGFPSEHFAVLTGADVSLPDTQASSLRRLSSPS